jgi:NADH:ubiquinone oxidoreductase subunit 5 (subunit L)/multisubunit Na+/H+ antiporter MnhA subunit
MVVATAVGVIAGALTYLAGHAPAQALLAAGAAIGGTADLASRLLPARRSAADTDQRDLD